MTATNITSAIKILNPLLDALEAAYWDTSDVLIKDRLFDLVSCIHAELSELAKLSITDLDFPYETITPEFAGCCQKLSKIFNEIDSHFPRTKTAKDLKSILPDGARLLKACEL